MNWQPVRVMVGVVAFLGVTASLMAQVCENHVQMDAAHGNSPRYSHSQDPETNLSVVLTTIKPHSFATEPSAQETQPSPDEAASTDAQAEAFKKLGEAVETIGKNITVVTGKEDWKIALIGELRGEVVYSSARPVSSSAPFFLTPSSPFGLDQETIDVHGKSSTIGGLVMGPEICGYKAGGMVLAALYSETLVDDIYGFLPIVAFGELRNDSQRFAAGLQLDVFNPLNPNMVNFNNLFASGNAGLYRGQIRAERYSYPSSNSQVTFQTAIGDPLPVTVTDAFRFSEPTGWPNLDMRLALALGPLCGEGLEAKRPFEIGVSTFVGQMRTTDATTGFRVVGDAWGTGIDLRSRVNDRFGFQLEAFVGQGLGTYGGDALQTVNTVTFEPIRGSGAWAEVYYYTSSSVHVHVGAGVDDPVDADVSPGQILRNETYFTNIFWDVTRDYRLGLEVSYRETSYRTLLDNDGIVVHSLASWKF